MKELELIQQVTGLKPSECSCERCQNMCKKAVCLGTPKDIEALLNAGYEDRLSATTWLAGIPLGIALLDMVQPTYDTERGCCTFFTDDGKCELHDLGLKPTEGRLANCKTTIEHFRNRPLIIQVIAEIWRAFKYFELGR